MELALFDPTIIEHPEKIGVGSYPSYGVERMVADLGRVGARWFYTWSPTLPELDVQAWSVGGEVTIAGAANDRHLVLEAGADAWAVQHIALDGGRSLSVTFEAQALEGATGGFFLEYRSTDGSVLGSSHQAVTAGTVHYTLQAATPLGAASARLVAYTASGPGFSLDDVSVRLGDREAVANGAFEAAARVDPAQLSGAFVPMAWGRADVGAAHAATSDILLTFNEPDNRDQARMTVEQALAEWPALMATGKRLGSPAVTTGETLGQGSWLQAFMDQAEARGYRVDFVAVHYYADNPDVAAFRAFLEAVHDAYGKPIWVTEWSLADWRDPGRFTAEQQAAFFAEAVQMLDDLPFVERHAWFGAYDGLDSWYLNSNLVDAEGRLTAVGEAFLDATSAPEPLAPPPPPDLAINGTARADTLRGGNGNDRMEGKDGADRLFGESGDDRLSGSKGADHLWGGDGDDLLNGGWQADKLLGEGGADRLIGDTAGMGAGSLGARDDLDGGSGDDVLIGDAEVMKAGSRGGEDKLVGGDGNDVLYGDAETMVATSRGGVDRLYGGDGDDWLFGEGRYTDGRTLGGADILVGGRGDDNLVGGGGNDRFVFEPGSGADVVHDFGRAPGDRDVIDLRAYGTSFGALAIAYGADGDAILALADGGVIRLVGVTGLSAADFLF